MNNQCVETLSDHANVLTDVSYLNWSFTVLATEWFSFPALPSRYMWSSISKVLLSYSFIQLIFTVDFCVTFWMVLIHYFGAIMASFLARASPFKVAPYVLVTMFLSFFFNFLFWPNRMLQAHLVLTLPQPWNQQWFLLVGFGLPMICMMHSDYFFIKNLSWSQTKWISPPRAGKTLL